MIVKLKYRWNCLRRDAGWYIHSGRSRLTRATGARILLYHGVCPGDHLRFNTLFLKLKTWEAQLRFYKKYYNVISLDDFYQQRFSHDRFNLCLTFDDGLANNYQYVLPLLQQYQLPATFFITGIRDAGHDILWNDFLAIASHAGPQELIFQGERYRKNRFKKYVSLSSGQGLADRLRSSGFPVKEKLIRELSSLGYFKNVAADPDYWLQMTQEQIRELSFSPLVTIGAHGYHHNDLAQLPVDTARNEMARSKSYLERITGKEIKALAFPYGSYSGEVKDEAKKIGFSQLLATRFLLQNDGDDATMKERLTINPFISVTNQMHANITGFYR